ncbi:MAG: septum formation initiator family protein [Desulfobacteraceae bacterium]|nr:septum formation initiator family protein [Desulfobacteraceae bacterium]
MTVIKKTGIFISLLIIMLLFGLIVFSEKGVMDYKVLKKQETEILEQTQIVEQNNQKLETEIKSLKTDIDYIKHIAKHEHDMTEEDELIFKEKRVNKKDTP